MHTAPSFTFGSLSSTFRRSQIELPSTECCGPLIFNDCVLSAVILTSTSDVSKKRLSKCGSNEEFDAKRPANGCRWLMAAEHGNWMVAAFVLAVKFRRFSASGRSMAFESMRVTMNLRRVPVTVLLTLVACLSTSVGVACPTPFLLAPLSSLTLRFKLLLMLLLLNVSDEASAPAAVLPLLIRAVFRSFDDSDSTDVWNVSDMLLVDPVPLLPLTYVEFSSISGNDGFWNLIDFAEVCSELKSKLSRSSIDAAMSYSYSSLIIFSLFFWYSLQIYKYLSFFVFLFFSFTQIGCHVCWRLRHGICFFVVN